MFNEHLRSLIYSLLPLQRDPVQQWAVPEHQHQVLNWDLRYATKESVSNQTILLPISAPARQTATGPATRRTSAPPRAEAWRETARLGKKEPRSGLTIHRGKVGSPTRRQTQIFPVGDRVDSEWVARFSLKVPNQRP